MDCPWVQSAFNESVSVGTEESCAWVTPNCTPHTRREGVAIRVQTMLQFWTFRERTFFLKRTDIARFSHFEFNKKPAHSGISANQSKLLLLSLNRELEKGNKTELFRTWVFRMKLRGIRSLESRRVVAGKGRTCFYFRDDAHTQE